ncbi:PEP-CTERM sorting domain-containing protein [Marinobacter sp.]|uniref:PEP-CTERM sorting domain-containing protein n=1 Tax=Marinobacter sp. TaxID=50741 RepID=UPI003561C3E5
MKKITQGLALAAVMGASGFAQAAFINAVANGNAPGVVAEQSVPGDNGYATGGDGLGVWTADTPYYSVGDTVLFGHNLKSTTADPFKLTFTYLGKEASDNNQFYWGNTLAFDTNSNPDDQFSAVFYGGMDQFLGFSFKNQPGVTVNNDGANGSQFVTANPNSSVNFNLFYVAEDEYVISFDDGYTGDDNHDDMIIHVKASKVPEPGTLALFGLGLAGIAVRMKGRKKA